MRSATLATAGLAALLVLASCGGDDDAEATQPTDSAALDDTTATDTAPATGEHVTLRLGYFPNVTHATALVGVEKGIFADALGDDVTLETSTFNAGGEAVEALFADAIDATYIGPNPAINGFAKSDGEALRIVSGATSGGAFLDPLISESRTRPVSPTWRAIPAARSPVPPATSSAL